MQRMIIDTDAGVDDAFALIMALVHPDVHVEAITTVFGNVPVDQATRNAFTILDVCGNAVPVYQGQATAMFRPLGAKEDEHRQQVHGADGLGGLGTTVPNGIAQQEHAVDVIIDRILREPGETTLVTLGPLTNVALALLREPRLATAVRHIYMMGGAANALGNVTPAAEFNVFMDPEATRVLFQSGAPVTMVGWELVWGDMLMTPEELDNLRSSDSPRARFAAGCSHTAVSLIGQLTGTPALALPDAITVAIAIDGSICRVEHLYVAVETSSDLTRGETVVDRFGVTGQPPNAHVCFDPDAARFKRMLFDALTT